MEPTYKLIIAMLVAYTPFFWYWVGRWFSDARRSEAERRRYGRRKSHNIKIEWWEQ